MRFRVRAANGRGLALALALLVCSAVSGNRAYAGQNDPMPQVVRSEQFTILMRMISPGLEADRIVAIEQVGDLVPASTEIRGILSTIFSSPGEPTRVRIAAGHALLAAHSAQIWPRVRAIISDEYEDLGLRMWAVRQIPLQLDFRSLPLITDLAMGEQKNEWLRLHAILAVAGFPLIELPKFFTDLLTVLPPEARRLRAAAMRGIGRQGGVEHVNVLLDVLDASSAGPSGVDIEEAQAAMSAVSNILGDPKIAADGPPPTVAAGAVEVLTKLIKLPQFAQLQHQERGERFSSGSLREPWAAGATLESEDFEVLRIQQDAMRLIATLRAPASESILLEVAGASYEPELRVFAIDELARYPAEDTARFLTSLLEEQQQQPDVTAAALAVLARINNSHSVAGMLALIEARLRPESTVRDRLGAIVALGLMSSQDATKRLLEIVRDRANYTGDELFAAVRGLAGRRDQSIVSELSKLAFSPAEAEGIRLEALTQLAGIGATVTALQSRMVLKSVANVVRNRSNSVQLREGATQVLGTLAAAVQLDWNDAFWRSELLDALRTIQGQALKRERVGQWPDYRYALAILALAQDTEPGREGLRHVLTSAGEPESKWLALALIEEGPLSEELVSILFSLATAPQEDFAVRLRAFEALARLLNRADSDTRAKATAYALAEVLGDPSRRVSVRLAGADLMIETGGTITDETTKTLIGVLKREEEDLNVRATIGHLLLNSKTDSPLPADFVEYLSSDTASLDLKRYIANLSGPFTQAEVDASGSLRREARDLFLKWYHGARESAAESSNLGQSYYDLGDSALYALSWSAQEDEVLDTILSALDQSDEVTQTIAAMAASRAGRSDVRDELSRLQRESRSELVRWAAGRGAFGASEDHP